MEYFKSRKHDLLVIDFTKGDKWEKLCDFLNVPIPDVKFPHYNKTKWDEKKFGNNKFRMWRKRIKNNFKIRYIDLLGLWKKNNNIREY